MTVEQLKSFIQSSRRLGHTDKQVADYLRNVKVTQRLDAVLSRIFRRPERVRGRMEALRKLGEETQVCPRRRLLRQSLWSCQFRLRIRSSRAAFSMQASEYARSYSKRLPNFICTQVTRRYVDPSGLEFWQSQDVIVSKLSFFEQKEDYKVVLVNNRPVNTTMHRLGGTTTTGNSERW